MSGAVAERLRSGAKRAKDSTSFFSMLQVSNCCRRARRKQNGDRLELRGRRSATALATSRNS
jgi:hypothetical protein